MDKKEWKTKPLIKQETAMMNEYRVAKREGRGWHAAQGRDEGNGT